MYTTLVTKSMTLTPRPWATTGSGLKAGPTVGVLEDMCLEAKFSITGRISPISGGALKTRLTVI